MSENNYQTNQRWANYSQSRTSNWHNKKSHSSARVWAIAGLRCGLFFGNQGLEKDDHFIDCALQWLAEAREASRRERCGPQGRTTGHKDRQPGSQGDGTMEKKTRKTLKSLCDVFIYPGPLLCVVPGPSNTRHDFLSFQPCQMLWSEMLVI